MKSVNSISHTNDEAKVYNGLLKNKEEVQLLSSFSQMKKTSKFNWELQAGKQYLKIMKHYPDQDCLPCDVCFKVLSSM